MPPPLSGFRVLTFDCYGTLIDWETGIWDALQPLLAANPGCEVARPDALRTFGEAEHDVETERPGLRYEGVLAAVHARLARAWGLATTPALDAAFGDSVPHWPAFADSAAALRVLAARYRLAVLSNVSRSAFAASNRKLGVAFDAVYTAEEIGSYKPSRANFDFMLARLFEDHGLAPSDVLHVAQSLFHDHVPAKALGLSTAWIDRQRLSAGGDWGATARVEERPEPDYVFFDVAGLAEAVRTRA